MEFSEGDFGFGFDFWWMKLIGAFEVMVGVIKVALYIGGIILVLDL